MKPIGKKRVCLFSHLSVSFTVRLTFFTLCKDQQKYGSFALLVVFYESVMQLIHRAGPCRGGGGV